MTDVVVHGAFAVYLSADRPPVTDGWVAISAGTVEAVGSGPPPTGDVAIDARGCVVVPGLVCTHHHLFQGSSRAVPTEPGLGGWLPAHYSAWSRLRAEDVAAAAELSIAQLLVRGSTTVAGFEFIHRRDEDFVEPVTKAADALGIRLMYVRGTTPVLEPGVEQELARLAVDVSRLVEPREVALAQIEQTLARPVHARLRWASGPTTPVVDDGGEFQHELNRISDDAGTPIHVHFHPLTGAGAGSGYALASELGLVRHGNWFAHGSKLTTEDVAKLAAAGVGVTHCPSASLLLGYPLPSLREWIRANDRVAVAVDGAASNDRGSLLAEAQMVFYTQGQREIAGVGGRLSPEECLQLVTAAPARAIGWEGVGALTPGSLGDLAAFDLLDLDSAGAAPRPDLALFRLFRTHPGARARGVLVGGEVVVGEGELLTGDEASIAAAANRSAARLAGIEERVAV